MNDLKRRMLNGILILIMIMMVTPILYVFLNSFAGKLQIEDYVIKATQEEGVGQNMFKKEYVKMKFIPDKVTLKQYYETIIEDRSYMVYFWNSVKLIVPIVFFNTIVSVLGGFAFAKMKFPYKNRIFLLYVLIMLMPYQATLVPNFIIAKIFGIHNNFLGIILPAIFNPFGVFLMRQFINYIPDSCIESARVEGAGDMKILKDIIIPMSKNGIIALIILTSIEAWNMVEQPLIYLTSQKQYPLSIMLTYIENDTNIFAMATIFMLPMIFLFLKGASQFVEGIEYTQLK